MRRVTLLAELAEVHSGNLNIRLWSHLAEAELRLSRRPHRKTNVKKTDDKKQKCKNCEGKGTLKKGDKVVRCQEVRRHRHQAMT